MKHWFKSGNLLIFLGVLVVLWGGSQVITNLRGNTDQNGDMADPEFQTVSEQGFAPMYEPLNLVNLVSKGDKSFLEIGPGTSMAVLPDQPTPAPTPIPNLLPDRIVIPSIHLDAPIIQAKSRLVKSDKGALYQQWMAPDEFAVGWQTTSATLGMIGNTVLYGHHNIHGEVFKELVNLTSGAEIILYSGTHEFHYVVSNTMILPELGQPVEVRLSNAQWIQASDDERVTMVTCWPATGNSHRLIVVAVPVR